jgi:hypothetical protein
MGTVEGARGCERESQCRECESECCNLRMARNFERRNVDEGVKDKGG